MYEAPFNYKTRLICDVTTSFFEIIASFWYHKIDFLISQKIISIFFIYKKKNDFVI